MVKFPPLGVKQSLALYMAMFLGAVSIDLPVYGQALSRKNVAIIGFQHGVHRDEEKSVSQTIRDTLQSKEDFQVLSESTVEVEIMQPMSRLSQASSEKIQSAYEHFVQGVEHYRTLELAQAIRELNRAVKGYRAGIGSLQDNHYLLYSHLYLGMALYFDGRENEGKKIIQEMVKLDTQRKTRKLPSRDFPPKIVEIHSNQAAIVQKLPSGTIHIDSSPSAAKVMLDGMDVGETPVTISDVPAGEHFIAIDQAGHKLYKQLLDVKEGEQNIIAKLEQEKIFLAKNQFEQEKDSQQTRILQSAAKEHSIDYFILGQVEANDKQQLDMKLQSYDVMAGKYSSVFTKSVSGKPKKVSQRVVKAVEQWIDAVVKKVSTPITGNIDFQKDFQEPSYAKKEVKKDKGFNTNLLWIGLGALAVGVGGYFILAGSGGSMTSNVLNVDNPLN
ncbi:MAG: PEGA domain-containing protein [Bdellovibrionota bacterium]